jgi:hypothetical protein
VPLFNTGDEAQPASSSTALAATVNARSSPSSKVFPLSLKGLQTLARFRLVNHDMADDQFEGCEEVRIATCTLERGDKR